MNIPFPPADLFGRFLTLEIYPPSTDKSLRPWDSADEYLLEQVHERIKADDKLSLSVVNDTNGALTLSLIDRINYNLNDSYTHREGIVINGRTNGLTDDPVMTNISDGLGGQTGLIIMKIPQSLELFKYQLSKIGESLTEETPILAAGMSKLMTPHFYEAFEEAANGANYSLIKKRSRYYQGVLKPQKKDTREWGTNFTYDKMEMVTLPGVFSFGKLDLGTQFLLEHFPRLDNPTLIVDPGCGCGILGIKAALTWPEARIIATDSSAMAVESTRLSAEKNGVSGRMEIRHTHLLTGIEDNSADLVICNPPFHQQQRVNLDSGFAFIEDSFRVLKEGGQLFLVANRYLGYEKKLKELSQGAMIIGQNKKYRVHMCRK
jgi:23S rRNA (guanine1835-N2)-methyltransferase